MKPPDRAEVGVTVPVEGPVGRVGLVAGTEDSTPLEFVVALDETSYLQLDDVIRSPRRVWGL